MQHISVSLKSILRIQYKGVRDYNRSKYKIYTENERSKIHLGTIFAGRIVSTVLLSSKISGNLLARDGLPDHYFNYRIPGTESRMVMYNNCKDVSQI
jgi:hypothetical protein